MFAPLMVRAMEAVVAAEDPPEPEDVVAGWTGFAVFILLIVAVVVIGFFLTRSLRRVDKAKEEGRLVSGKELRASQQAALRDEKPAEEEKND